MVDGMFLGHLTGRQMLTLGTVGGILDWVLDHIATLDRAMAAHLLRHTKVGVSPREGDLPRRGF